MFAELSLIFFMLLSFQSEAADRCFKDAKKAATQYALDEDYITKPQDFSLEFDSEESEVLEVRGTWQKELHTFYNTNMGITVSIDFARGKCFIKNVDWFQNDQDWD